MLGLTHWGRVTHICVGNLTIIGSDNGLSPGRRQAIIWTNAGILLIGPWGTNFSDILIGIQTFSFKKLLVKMSSAKWRLFRFGLNVLKLNRVNKRGHWSHNDQIRKHVVVLWISQAELAPRPLNYTLRPAKKTLFKMTPAIYFRTARIKTIPLKIRIHLDLWHLPAAVTIACDVVKSLRPSDANMRRESIIGSDKGLSPGRR